MKANDSLAVKGQKALEQGRLTEAERWFQLALTEAPASVEALRGLGYALLQLNRPSEALGILEEAVRRAPTDLLARLLLGRLCLRLQEPEEAEKHFQRILTAIPTSEPARSGLVDAAIARNKLDDAERIAGQILELNPHSEAGLFAAARIAEMHGDYDGARARYDRLVALAPGNAEHRYNRSRSLLRSGQFSEGWKEYESRFAAGAVLLPNLTTPRWTGTSVDRLLLLAEQGLGDVIQFCRFVSLVKAIVGRVVLACPSTLASLLARSLAVETASLDEPLPAHDAHLPLMSVPHVLCLGARTLAWPGRYLVPDDERSAAWRQRLNLSKHRLHVGIIQSTSVGHATEQRPQTRRSCEPAAWAPLADVANVDFFSLQVGPRIPATGDAASWLSRRVDIADFEDTAAIVDFLDMLVSVDTATAHIGGALDKPVALLLPYAADWRWMLDRDRTAWYPSVRLFRQIAPGDWSGPLACVRDMLASEAAQLGGKPL